MATVTTDLQTLGELLRSLGGISADRIRLRPPLGTAVVEDVVAIEQKENRLCELVSGVLVEKVMGYQESLIAMVFVAKLYTFIEPKNLGAVTGPDGMLQLWPGLVRMPDVAFTSWSRMPKGVVPTKPAPEIVPELVIEVLSKSNTAGEMERKLDEYFEAGVCLAWLVDLEKREVAVYVSANEFTILPESSLLTGGDVLPGFELSLKELFAKLDGKR